MWKNQLEVNLDSYTHFHISLKVSHSGVAKKMVVMGIYETLKLLRKNIVGKFSKSLNQRRVKLGYAWVTSIKLFIILKRVILQKILIGQ